MASLENQWEAFVLPKKKEDKPTDAERWLERIDRAKKVKEEWRKTFRIDMAYDYFEGRQRPSHIPNEEWITINLVYSNLLAMLPSLYAADPYFYVKLKRSYKPDPMLVVLYERRGKMRQAMLNYLKEELMLKAKARLSVLDGFFQFGIIKIHHEAEMVENPDAGQPIMDNMGMPLLGENSAPLMEPERIPASEAYHITRVHPDDFLVDEDAGPLNEDVSWKAQRIKRQVEDVKSDERFDSTVRRQVKATEISDPIQQQREQRKKGSIQTTDKVEPDIVVQWEIYDIKNKQWMVIAEGTKDFLIKPETMPAGIEDDPFSDLRFTIRDDSWYPLPPVSQWLDPQKEYCTLRSKLMTHRKRFDRKYIAIEGMIDKDEVGKLEAGGDGTIVWGSTAPAEACVSPIRDAPLDQNHTQEINLLLSELAMMSVGTNQRQSGRGVESATEAGIIERRLQVQEGDWLGIVVDFVKTIARKLDQTVQVHITRDQAIRVSGPEGESWELVKTTDYDAIEGEYEYSVNVGATTPRLPEIERAQWIAFLNLLASAPQLALSKRLLKHGAELHHIDDEVLINEIYQIAQKMMTGQIPMSGQQGSVPGQPGLPGTASAGMAAGMANVRGGT